MTHRREQLFLHEEVMLLALSEERGTVELGAWYEQAVGAAVLAELLLAGRVRLEADKRRTLVVPVDRDPLGEPLIDEWLERIHADPKRRKLDHWVSEVSDTSGLKRRVGRALADKRILRVEEKRVFFILRTTYPERDPEPERAIRARLHDAIFTDASDLDPRTVVLLSLAKNTGLLEYAFSKKQLKARAERIARIVSGEETGRAAREVIEAAEAMILVTCILPTVII